MADNEDIRSEGMPEYTERDFQALFKGTKGDTGDTGEKGDKGTPGKTGGVQWRLIFAYSILAIGTVLGIFFTGQHSSNQLKKNINELGTRLCLTEKEPTSNTSKFNDLIDSIIQVRTETRDQAIKDRAAAIKRGDMGAAKEAKEAVRINNLAIAKYEQNKIIPPTPGDCAAPLIP